MCAPSDHILYLFQGWLPVFSATTSYSRLRDDITGQTSAHLHWNKVSHFPPSLPFFSDDYLSLMDMSVSLASWSGLSWNAYWPTSPLMTMTSHWWWCHDAVRRSPTGTFRTSLEQHNEKKTLSMLIREISVLKPGFLPNQAIPIKLGVWGRGRRGGVGLDKKTL